VESCVSVLNRRCLWCFAFPALYVCIYSFQACYRSRVLRSTLSHRIPNRGCVSSNLFTVWPQPALGQLAPQPRLLVPPRHDSLVHFRRSWFRIVTCRMGLGNVIAIELGFYHYYLCVALLDRSMRKLQIRTWSARVPPWPSVGQLGMYPSLSLSFTLSYIFLRALWYLVSLCLCNFNFESNVFNSSLVSPMYCWIWALMDSSQRGISEAHHLISNKSGSRIIMIVLGWLVDRFGEEVPYSSGLYILFMFLSRCRPLTCTVFLERFCWSK